VSEGASKKKEYIARWSATETKQINAALEAGLIDQQDIATVVHSGKSYLDLRGLKITCFLKRRTFTSIDFSFSEFVSAGQFGFCKVEDCIFLGAKLLANRGDQFLSVISQGQT